MEVTQPKQQEVEQIASLLPPGTKVFISDVPRRTGEDLVSACTAISSAGLVPVPHMAARGIESAASLERLLAACVNRGKVGELMLIAGDRPAPAGPFGDVADVLRSGVIARSGIVQISVAGYPEGHPTICADQLEAALTTKLGLLDEMGVAGSVVSQFTLTPAPVTRWISRLREAGITCPIGVGVVGPATAATLMKFAVRCGVRTSGRHLARGAQLGRVLLRHDPEPQFAPLASFAGEASAGPIWPHFFSFGGPVAAARWIRQAQNGDGGAPEASSAATR